MAASAGYKKAAQALIDGGARLHLQDRWGQTAEDALVAPPRMPDTPPDAEAEHGDFFAPSGATPRQAVFSFRQNSSAKAPGAESNRLLSWIKRLPSFRGSTAKGATAAAVHGNESDQVQDMVQDF